jgi:hypothetical protein
VGCAGNKKLCLQAITRKQIMQETVPKRVEIFIRNQQRVSCYCNKPKIDNIHIAAEHQESSNTMSTKPLVRETLVDAK